MNGDTRCWIWKNDNTLLGQSTPTTPFPSKFAYPALSPDMGGECLQASLAQTQPEFGPGEDSVGTTLPRGEEKRTGALPSLKNNWTHLVRKHRHFRATILSSSPTKVARTFARFLEKTSKSERHRWTSRGEVNASAAGNGASWGETVRAHTNQWFSPHLPNHFSYENHLHPRR